MPLSADLTEYKKAGNPDGLYGGILFCRAVRELKK